MTINEARGTHVSRYLAQLRKQRGIKPGQLAARLEAKNISKVGSLIRQFELNGELSEYWLENLIIELQPDPELLKQSSDLDQANYIKEIQQQKQAWECWADHSIDPYLTVRYIPAVYGVREVPSAFISTRKIAEAWAIDELKRFGAKGFLNWTRRDQTFFDKGGSNPRRFQATFENPPATAWMKVSGSATKFVLKEDWSSKEKNQAIREAGK